MRTETRSTFVWRNRECFITTPTQPFLELAKLILASQSPRRRSLLKQLVDDFEVTTAEVEELLEHQDGPEALALENSLLKAKAIAKKHPNQWVLGSDTVVECDGVLLAKPQDRADAIRMMKQLSGRKHNVHSGVVLCKVDRSGTEQLEQFVETSEVVFFNLSQAQIESYVDTMHPEQYAGGYPIQFILGTIVSGFDGSFTNVVGLPLEKLKLSLQSLGILPESKTVV